MLPCLGLNDRRRREANIKASLIPSCRATDCRIFLRPDETSDAHALGAGDRRRSTARPARGGVRAGSHEPARENVRSGDRRRLAGRAAPGAESRDRVTAGWWENSVHSPHRMQRDFAYAMTENDLNADALIDCLTEFATRLDEIYALYLDASQGFQANVKGKATWIL